MTNKSSLNQVVNSRVALRREPGNRNSFGQMKLSPKATCGEWNRAFQKTIWESPHPLAS